MTDSEFYDACENIDWMYESSDNRRVWQKGEHAFQTLVRQIKQNPVRREIYDGFHAHAFSGPMFKTEKAEKPERPE